MLLIAYHAPTMPILLEEFAKTILAFRSNIFIVSGIPEVYKGATTAIYKLANKRKKSVIVLKDLGEIQALFQPDFIYVVQKMPEAMQFQADEIVKNLKEEKTILLVFSDVNMKFFKLDLKNYLYIYPNVNEQLSNIAALAIILFELSKYLE